VKNAVRAGNSPISAAGLTLAGAALTFDQSFEKTDVDYLQSILQAGSSGVAKAQIMVKASGPPQFKKSDLNEDLKTAFNAWDRWGVSNKGRAATRN
jgi:hypothetical protein